MGKIHFEIGKKTGRLLDNGLAETASVFFSSSLNKCLKEWEDKKYTTPEYFIDVWEQDKFKTPFPVAEININEIY